jgi:hypothetical protein
VTPDVYLACVFVQAAAQQLNFDGGSKESWNTRNSAKDEDFMKMLDSAMELSDKVVANFFSRV